MKCVCATRRSSSVLCKQQQMYRLLVVLCKKYTCISVCRKYNLTQFNVCYIAKVNSGNACAKTTGLLLSPKPYLVMEAWIV